MATQRCPQCASPVDVGAESCSTCGYPIRRDPAGVRDAGRPVSDQATERVPLIRAGRRPEEAAPPRERIVTAPRQRGSSPLPVWALALLVLALLSVGAWYFLFGRGGDEPAATVDATPTPQATATSATTAPPSEPEPVTYEVQAGDTLSTIAQQFGTTTQALAAANEIDNPDLITLGQVLVIPTETATPTPQGSATPTDS